MHPKYLSVADFRYDLPQERIADHPLPERDASKLLVYREGVIGEDRYRNIASHLPGNSLLIFNDTKVVEARIVFQKPSGALIEIFCLEPPPEYSDVGAAMLQTGKVRWKCLIGGASKWKPGQVLRLEVAGKSPGQADGAEGDERGREGLLVLEARWLEKLEGCFLIELSWSDPGLSFAGLLHHAGLMPLPPYIHRPAGQADKERYQTVYARHDGSVAAPTAGLHFTGTILQALGEKNIQTAFVTLHVGAGTFMPVKGETLGQHVMHSEFIAVGQDTLKRILDTLGKGTVVPVGTTSLRTIESLYWLGMKVMQNPGLLPTELGVGQWDAYEEKYGDEGNGSSGEEQEYAGRTGRTDAREALGALLGWMGQHGLSQLFTKTQLLITPGYDWKIAGALVTNFHQPGSTLLLLVASFIGEDWKKVYRYALDHSFRFLSYGDGSLLFRKP